MSVSRKYHFEPKVFEVGQIAAALKALLGKLDSRWEAKISIFRTLGDGTEEHQSGLIWKDITGVCDLVTERTIAHVAFGQPAGLGNLLISDVKLILGTEEDDYLSLDITAENADQLRISADTVIKELGLTQAPSPSERLRRQLKEDGEVAMPTLGQVVEELMARVSTLEAERSSDPRVTVFLSFQFDDKSKAYAAQVETYLRLMDVDVITGLGYEPRRVSEKVNERLSSGIDGVVLIEVAGSSSSWTRDEIARAQSPGVFLIPLVEAGGKFDSGIFGDHEYIRFGEGHVGDAFVGLVEGINYIRRQKCRGDSRG